MMPEAGKLTIVVLTLNEERHLPGCLLSVTGLRAPVLVVDSGSTDATVEIARAAGATVVEHTFTGYASQRQAALDQVATSWTLFVDADERLTPDLSGEIADVLTRGDRFAGYWIPRANWFGTMQLRGGGWWPDRQLRLVRTDRARMHPGREVHETIELDGPAADLTHSLIHLNYDDLAEFRAKQRHYARIRADHVAAEAASPPARRFAAAPVREFWRRFVRLNGYRDGSLGFALALILAWYEFRYWSWVAGGAGESVVSNYLPGSPSSARAHAVRHYGVHDGAPRRRGALRAPAIHRSNDLVAGGRKPADGPRSGVETPWLTVEDPTVSISVVIVSYNVRDKLAACLRSIVAWQEDSGFQSEVIIVDNASTDGTAAVVADRFPAARLIAADRNRGFSAGCNIGLRKASGETLILLNPDTEVNDVAFDVLHRYLTANRDVGVVGPRLVYPDGVTQPSRRRFPNLLTGLLESTIVQDVWHDNAVLRRYYVTDRPEDEVQDVDWLVGACLAVRREAIAAAGLLDERFFMYSEEVEWCHRIKQAGWRIVYLPDATVSHHEGSSSSQDVPRRQVDFDTSKVILFRRLHGNLVAELLRVYLLGTYALRMIVEGSKGLLGHKRGLRLARVALYWRGLRSGLRAANRISDAGR